MDLYPAVDVAGGRVARAPAGADVPLAVARAFATAGARWLHYVDMDRAYRRGANPAVTQEILGAGVAAVQVGGGLASEPDVLEVLSWGAARVILGGQPALDAEGVERIVRAVGPERLGIALDVADGRLAPRGAGGAVTHVTPHELARRIRSQGIRTVVYTDVRRDGALAGADIAGAAGVAELGLDVIVSGGIAGLEEVTRAREAGLAGVVIGRALYEGRFTLAEALQCAA